MYEPGLKYCQQCKDEYLAHVERCAACGIELVSGHELLAAERRKQERLVAGGLAIGDLERTVTIHAGSMTDLKCLKDLFAGEHIGARITGDESSCKKGCCPSRFYLEVRPADAADAQRIIGQEYLRMTGLAAAEAADEHAAFDPDADSVVCPACGYRFAPTVAACPDCGLCFS